MADITIQGGSVFDQNINDFKEPSALLIHETIRQEGEQELARPRADVIWSGVGGGLAMGLTVLGGAMIASRLPESEWRQLIVSFGFTLGFLVVILGRQGSISETALVSVLPVLSKPRSGEFARLATLWSTVIVGNLIGLTLMALLFALTPAIEHNIKGAILTEASKIMGDGVLSAFLRAGLAGWIIALAVWTSVAARSAKVAVVFLLVYLTGALGFHHFLAGSITVLTSVFSGDTAFSEYFLKFFIPVLFGNVIGGAGFVAILNHAQVSRERIGRERVANANKR